jgi:hypothetical protein
MWEDDFRGAQTQYRKSTRADVLRELEPTFDEMRREIRDLQGATGSDRQGRLLTSVQAASHDLKRRAYDEKDGVMASSPHYRNNPKVKAIADSLVAQQMQLGMDFANDPRGHTGPLTAATSRGRLRKTLLLAIDEAGIDLLGGGSPTASVVGGELAGSAGPGAEEAPARKLTAEEQEMFDKHYRGRGFSVVKFLEETGI